MTAKTTKPKFVLLDANIVIQAYRLGIWKDLIERVEVWVPSIIIRDEALFYTERIGGVPDEINLQQLVDDGKIKEISATHAELVSLYAVFDSVFIETIHEGENEALAFLLKGAEEELYSCTADARAIQAVAMIEMSHKGISMEFLLRSIGLQQTLEVQYTEDFFRRNLDIGRRNLITREGLAKE
ncbi:MAG: hypothetical protein IH975_05155 [Nitrospinae bacterium]|nr:hypothetical protein [Nitrospinota bacterium]